MSNSLGQYPTVARYSRIPTRVKVQFFWGCVVGSLAWWQLMKLTIFRVNPKRAEQAFLALEDENGELPEYIRKDAMAQRLMRDTLTVHNAAQMPNPGEVTAALQHDMDHRRLGALSSRVMKRPAPGESPVNA
eukprot:PhM_4_TR15844/c0_g1_i1/m.23939